MDRLWVVLCVAAVVCAGCKKSGTTAKSSGQESASESAIADDGQTVTLQAKWPVGNRYAQRMEVNGDTETHVPQMPKPMQQKLGSKHRWKE